MTRYKPIVRTNDPHMLSGLQPGQWIDYGGAKGRYMGRSATVWIAWGNTASKRFSDFAEAYRIQTGKQRS